MHYYTMRAMICVVLWVTKRYSAVRLKCDELTTDMRIEDEKENKPEFT
jgi:hypothetical protein